MLFRQIVQNRRNFIFNLNTQWIFNIFIINYFIIFIKLIIIRNFYYYFSNFNRDFILTTLIFAEEYSIYYTFYNTHVLSIRDILSIGDSNIV